MGGLSIVGKWRVDAALILLAALLGGGFFLDSLGRDPGRVAIVVDLAVGLVACLALSLRRRLPVPLAVALIPTILLSASAMGATAVAMSGVALYRSRVVTASVFLGHALFVAALFSLADDPGSFWQGLFVVLTLDAVMITSGLLVRSQHLLVRSAQERAREAEERHRLWVREARHAERERLAREMHDVLAHRISLLAVHAGALQVRRSAPEPERQAAGIIRQHAHDALEDLRAVIGMLRTEGDDDDRPQPTVEDVPMLIEQSRLAGTEVVFDRTDLARVPDGLGRHVYRVVREGLTNARKHAPGVPVRLRMTAGDGLTIEMSNSRTAGPVPPIPGAGSGLIGLRERMSLIGGRLDCTLTEGDFRLEAWIPWRT